MEHIKYRTADKSGESDKIINISILIQFIFNRFSNDFERLFSLHGATKVHFVWSN